MITYNASAEHITASQLSGGFFEGWPNPPAPETHLRLLRAASHVVLAHNPEQDVVGFITALSDGVLTAYIPLLEVLPAYRGQGIGAELVRRMMAQLRPIYMIDLLCDAALIPYYEHLGLTAARGMVMRNYESQSGLPDAGASDST